MSTYRRPQASIGRAALLVAAFGALYLAPDAAAQPLTPAAARHAPGHAVRLVSQAPSPSPSAAAPRIALTGVGRGFAGNVGRPTDGRGDDGDLVAGRLPALEHAAVLTPTTQAENIVRDRRTERMWIRRLDLLNGTDGLGARGNVRLDEPMSWQAGIDAATALEYAGFDDWRLPTVHELDSLVDFGLSEPALDPHAFPHAYNSLPSSYFWSSTTSPAVAWLAFYVNVRDGHRYPWSKASLFAVRPVRLADRLVADGGSGDSRSAESEGALNTDMAIRRTGQTTGYVGDRGDTGTGNGDDGDLMPGEEHAYDWADDGTIDTPPENLARDLVTGLTWIRNPSLVDGSGGDEATRAAIGSAAMDGDRALRGDGASLMSAAAIGGNVDLSTPLDWQTAVDRCAALRYAGYTNWRLPNVRELDSLVLPGRPDAPLLMGSSGAGRPAPPTNTCRRLGRCRRSSGRARP